MNEEASNEPGSQLTDPRFPEPLAGEGIFEGPGGGTDAWERLLSGSSIVGYRRQMGRATLFSKDGYGWSATPIPFDRSLPQSTIQAPSSRLYHGDVVLMAPASGAQTVRQLVVIVTDDGSEALYDPEQDELTALTLAWPPPSTPFARQRLGLAWETAGGAQLLAHVTEAIRFERKPAFSLAATASGIILTGILLFGWMQWLLLGSVGPFLSLTGGFFCCILHVTALRAGNRHLLSRKWAIAMTPRVAFICGGAVALACLSLGLGGARIFALTTATVLFTGLVWLLSVDLVAWQKGGYAREPKNRPKSRGRWG